MFKYYSVPAWTMGDKSRALAGNQNPGPGKYDPQDATTKTSPHPNDPKWAFPKNPRDVKYGNGNPGPGQYDSPGRGKIKAGYMGQKQGDMGAMNVPGPGTYDDQAAVFKHAKSPAYTMRAKGAMSNKKNVPGPGQYDPDAERVMWKSYSGKMVSKSARDQLGKFGVPGPGNYDPSNNTFGKSQGKFSRGPRDGFGGNPNPGPGAYDYNSSFGGKAGYSYGKQARDGAYGSGNPGPGTYDYKTTSLGGPAWKQGKTSRDWFKANANPAPGSYEHDPNAFVKTSGKINPEARSGTGPNYPGPGAYDGDFTVGRNQAPKFAFAKEEKRELDLGVPGPGAYDANGVPTKSSIAMDKRAKGLNYGNSNPGPGTYEQQMGADMKFFADGKYTFGRELRDKDKERLRIGPGDYDIPHSIPDVAGYNYPSKDKRKIHL